MTEGNVFITMQFPNHHFSCCCDRALHCSMQCTCNAGFVTRCPLQNFKRRLLMANRKPQTTSWRPNRCRLTILTWSWLQTGTRAALSFSAIVRHTKSNPVPQSHRGDYPSPFIGWGGASGCHCCYSRTSPFFPLEWSVHANTVPRNARRALLGSVSSSFTNRNGHTSAIAGERCFNLSQRKPVCIYHRFCRMHSRDNGYDVQINLQASNIRTETAPAFRWCYVDISAPLLEANHFNRIYPSVLNHWPANFSKKRKWAGQSTRTLPTLSLHSFRNSRYLLLSGPVLKYFPPKRCVQDQ